MSLLKNPFHAIPTTVGGDTSEINVLLEITINDRVKYEYEKEYGIVKVDRILKTPMPYPFNYGLIPQTWNEYDHDPLDAIILGKEKFLPGVLVPCRVVGMLNVDDSGERDDKVLCVPLGDSEYKGVKDISDLSPEMLEKVNYFLEHYKDLEKKTVKVNNTVNAKEARSFIEECMECYNKKFS